MTSSSALVPFGHKGFADSLAVRPLSTAEEAIVSHLWSSAATSATPYHDAIQNDLFLNSLGRVRFKEGKTGTINLVCSVENVRDLASVRHLHVTYRDARQGTGQVTAVLKKVSRQSGNIDNVVGIGSESVSAGTEIPPNQGRTVPKPPNRSSQEDPCQCACYGQIDGLTGRNAAPCRRRSGAHGNDKGLANGEWT
jgi:hypothetical protein